MTVINLADLVQVLLPNLAHLIAVVVLDFAHVSVVFCLKGSELITLDRLEFVNLDTGFFFGFLEVVTSFSLQLGNFLGASSLESVNLGAVELLEISIKLLGGLFFSNDLALVQLLENESLVSVHLVGVIKSSSLFPLQLSDFSGVLSLSSFQVGPVDAVAGLDGLVLVGDVGSVNLFDGLKLGG